MLNINLSNIDLVFRNKKIFIEEGIDEETCLENISRLLYTYIYRERKR
jgi:hypothetical protein